MRILVKQEHINSASSNCNPISIALDTQTEYWSSVNIYSDLVIFAEAKLYSKKEQEKLIVTLPPICASFLNK